MKNKEDVFVPTVNYQKMKSLCDELLGPALGVELSAVLGRAGRGKTTAAEKIFTNNPQTVYVLYQEGWTFLELLREIAFRLCGLRPRFRQVCFEMIQKELASHRRVIMVDEADRMNLKCLNILRNIHDICKVPIMLIGEESLEGNLRTERRLISRVRNTIVFEPVTQADVVVFYSDSIEQKLTPDMAAALLKYSGGDFRRVLTSAVQAERIMKASGMSTITDAVVKEICKNK